MGRRGRCGLTAAESYGRLRRLLLGAKPLGAHGEDMQFYWSVEKLPELTDLPKDERREVLSVCRRKTSWAGPVLAVGGIMGLTLYVGTLMGVKAGTWQWIVNIFIGAFLGMYVSIQIEAYVLRPVIRAYLQGDSGGSDA